MLKHIGKTTTSGNNVTVVYYSLPNDSDHALVVDMDALNDADRADLQRLVSTSEAQSLRSLHDHLSKTSHRSGTDFLSYYHNNRKLVRIKTTDVLMTPSSEISINLAELNRQIAKAQEGTSDIPDEELVAARNVHKQRLAEQEQETQERIGHNMIRQAMELEAQAKLMMDEAAKKRTQGKKMLGLNVPETTNAPAPNISEPIPDAPKKRGRPKSATKNKKETT